MWVNIYHCHPHHLGLIIIMIITITNTINTTITPATIITNTKTTPRKV